MAESETRTIDRPTAPATNGNRMAVGADAPEATERQRKAKPAFLLVLAIVVLAAGVFGVRYFRFASAHTGTDDAYITSDVVQIAPQVSGTVLDVKVAENQVVAKGQLLAILDDSTYKANVAQAQANLDAAVASAKGAGVNVGLIQETSGGQVEQARGQVAQADSGIASAEQDVARANAAISTAKAQARGAESNIGMLRSAVSGAIATQARAAAAVKAAQAQVTGAQAGIRSAQAGVDSAQAAYDRAASDAKRYSSLADQGAMSRQIADQAATTARSADAALTSARQQLEVANATESARESDLVAARAQYSAAQAGVEQARSQVASATDQASAARAGVAQTQAQRNAAARGVDAAEARKQQALGQLTSASTTPRQVAVSQTAHAQAIAKIEQARAALDQTKLQLSYTRIYAPVSGRVSKKTVEVGALVQPGTPLMAIVPQNKIWVVANLKETQLDGVQPGRAADIDVDSVPGRVFHGKVDSISAATGATFALLPPDNATGNFTKVVQRIPVKILLDPGQADTDRLAAGMSVNVTIETK